MSWCMELCGDEQLIDTEVEEPIQSSVPSADPFAANDNNVLIASSDGGTSPKPPGASGLLDDFAPLPQAREPAAAPPAASTTPPTGDLIQF